jgi:chromosome partitioning protein
MHTLAFVNQKGGCGKTTSAVNLAGALARAGSRVLVVDLDPQAHATMALGCPVDDEPTLADVLLHGTPPREVVRSAPGGIALLPSTIELSEFEEAAERVLHSEGFLGRALHALRDAYDLALVDCPPRADGILTANALRAADTAVLVVETGAFALQGACRAIDILEVVASDMETEFDLRVLGTLFDRRSRLARELLIGTQARFGPVMFDTVIHDSVRLREAAAFGVPVQVLDPDCRAVRDFEALAEEVRALLHARPRPVRELEEPETAEGTTQAATGLAFQGVRETWTG